MELNKVILYPLSTEKSIRLMEAENKLMFIVDIKATKKDVKNAVEEIFNVKVTKVTTLIGPNGKKKAFVKVDYDYPAIDVATQLGMM